MTNVKPTADWQRPAFEPGNALPRTHGAFHAPSIEPRAAELVEAATAAVPYLAAPDFAPAVRAWARSEASVALLAEWLNEHGLIDEHGKPRPAVETLLRFERMAASHRARLGLDPASRARLERELADAAKGRFDLQAMIDEGRKTLAARTGGAT